MTDDTTQSMPAETAPTPIPEVAAPIPPSEPTPATVEEPVTIVVEQATSAEPASVITEASPQAPESTVEPPVVGVSAPEPPPATSATIPTPQQQSSTTQSSQSVPHTKWSVDNRARATAMRVGRKEARLAKVVELTKRKGRITNDDIEKLLHVSDATASRYGMILVQRGLLRREGKGRGVGYIIPS